MSDLPKYPNPEQVVGGSLMQRVKAAITGTKAALDGLQTTTSPAAGQIVDGRSGEPVAPEQGRGNLPSRVVEGMKGVGTLVTNLEAGKGDPHVLKAYDSSPNPKDLATLAKAAVGAAVSASSPTTASSTSTARPPATPATTKATNPQQSR